MLAVGLLRFYPLYVIINSTCSGFTLSSSIQRAQVLLCHHQLISQYPDKELGNMSESIPTLVIISLLSRRFGSTDRHCASTTVDRILHGASIVLTVTFSVALSLPPSSPLALDFATRDTSLDTPRECSSDHLQCEQIKTKLTLPDLSDDLRSADLSLRRARTVTEYRDAVNVQSSWMGRTRLSPRKGLNRFDDMPAVMRCDSVSSLSSGHSSILSSRSSQDLLLTPPRSNRKSMHRRVSWKQNDEWAIVE